MKVYERLILYFCLAFILYLLFPVERFPVRENRYVEDLRSTYMQSTVQSLSQTNDGVHLVFKGEDRSYFGRFQEYNPVPTEPDYTYTRWSGDLRLKVGDEFNRRPDHHAWAKYTLESINPSGIVLSYVDGFSNHSFGKNYTSKKLGKIRLHWVKETAANNASDGIPPPHR